MPITIDTTTKQRHAKSNRLNERTRFRETANVWSDIATGWADALDSVVDAMGRGLDPQYMRLQGKRCACGCDHDDCSCERDCSPDSCHCQCCIGDADLVVYARRGEVRIIPIQLENHRRRTRDITLDLSEFRTSSGRPVPLEATIAGDQTFELEACDDRVVTLLVRPAQSDNDGRESNELIDFDDCLVAYADLRVAGCDIRPIRIAVALLPRDCAPYVAGCGCGCC